MAYLKKLPITVSAESTAWTVFARSNAGIVGSNSTQGMDVCVHLFCVYVVLYVGIGLATGWSPVQGVLPTVYRIQKLEKRPRPKQRGVKSKVVHVLNKLSTTPWRRMGSECIDPRILDLGTRWRWVVGFTPRPLYSRGKNTRYPLDRRLCGPQSRSGRRGEEKILDPTGTRTPTPRSSSP
jgi:hypothetical protein